MIPFRKGLVAAGRSGTSLSRRQLLIALIAAQAAIVVAGIASGTLTNWQEAPMIGMTVAWIEALSKEAGA